MVGPRGTAPRSRKCAAAAERDEEPARGTFACIVLRFFKLWKNLTHCVPIWQLSAIGVQVYHSKNPKYVQHLEGIAMGDGCMPTAVIEELKFLHFCIIVSKMVKFNCFTIIAVICDQV